MRPETEALLRRTAETRTPEDEVSAFFNVCECSGANFDDAYCMGMNRGEILQARLILQMEGVTP